MKRTHTHTDTHSVQFVIGTGKRRHITCAQTERSQKRRNQQMVCVYLHSTQLHTATWLFGSCRSRLSVLGVIQQRERPQFDSTGCVYDIQHSTTAWCMGMGLILYTYVNLVDVGWPIGCAEWKRYIKLIYERSFAEMCLFRVLLLSIFIQFFPHVRAPRGLYYVFGMAAAATPSASPSRRCCHSRYAANEPFERAELSQRAQRKMPKKKNERAKIRTKWQPQLFIAHYILERDGWRYLRLHTILGRLQQHPPQQQKMTLAFNCGVLLTVVAAQPRAQCVDVFAAGIAVLSYVQ